MKGQVFTVAKLHYVNGVVYFTAREGVTDLATLAKHSVETTKSGNVKHPVVRVRTLARLAEGIGLIRRPSKSRVEITELGRRYYEARANEKWTISEQQKQMLRAQILSTPPSSPTIHAISSLFDLVRKGYTEDELARQYAISIGKDNAWKSDVTYKGFTEFGLSYLTELGLLDPGNELERSGPIQREGSLQTRNMKTILFTWNPRKWQWDDLAQAVYEVNVEGRYLDEWSCGRTRDISVGDRAFLMRLGKSPKGIIGSGVVVSTPREGPHWNRERADLGNTVFRVEILFDVLSEIPLIDERALASEVLGRHKWFPQASGTHIPDDIAKHLEMVWSRTTGTEFEPPEPADIPAIRAEGTKRSRLITQCERNPKAREDCIKHHGRMCKVCGLVFEKQYGHIGKGFIHVHHIVPISEVGREYEVDPVKDLCPVCPNCHAMLHKQTPPYGILQLKTFIENFRSTGSSGHGKMPH